MNNITEHLEHYLGRIDFGWKDLDGTIWDFNVVQLSGGPIENGVNYSTLGLSNTPLLSPVSEKQIRHELIIMTRPGFCVQHIPILLYQVGRNAVINQCPYLRGDILDFKKILFPGTMFTGLYVSIPVYIADEFSEFISPQNVATVFAWLIPVTSAEVIYVKEKGWEMFEDLLLTLDPDLLDWNRKSII